MQHKEFAVREEHLFLSHSNPLLSLQQEIEEKLDMLRGRIMWLISRKIVCYHELFF